jgi:hypothetical protein
MKQDKKGQIPGIDLTFADGSTGRIWGTSGLDDLRGNSFAKAALYLRQRARQDEAFEWTIVIELDHVISSSARPLLTLMQTLREIVAEKADRRSVRIEWRIRPGDDILHNLATGVREKLEKLGPMDGFSIDLVEIKKSGAARA